MNVVDTNDDDITCPSDLGALHLLFVTNSSLLES